MTTVAQRSFAGGEIAPALYARVDTSKYATGLRTCRNFFVMRHGGVANRPGTKFVGEVKDSSKTVRLIPFVFNSDQTYVLEFGDQYMRVIRNGAYVKEASQNITGITNANPGVVTYSGADNYTAGDTVLISGVVGAIANNINGRVFKVGTVVAGSNTFELLNLDGTNFNTTSLGSYTSGGTVEELYTITTPYLEADLDELQYVQSADVITLVHPNYAPRELSRTGHTSWTLSTISFVPSISRPTGGSSTSITGGSTTFRYRVTAILEETYEESLPGFGSTNSITGATAANPVVITYSGSDNYITGDLIYIDGVVGMTQLNGNTYKIANLNTGANTFELQTTAGVNVDGSAYTAYSSGGTVHLTYIRVDSAADPSVSDPHILTWTAVSGAVEYNIYKEVNGVYGYLGTAASTSFSDVGLDPDTTDTPPSARDPFNSANNYPSTVTYFQQRRGFANTNNDPEKVWFTRSGHFTNLTTSSPVQDDDAVTFTLAGRQVNEIRHLLDIGKLIALTSGGEWAIEGDASGILKPGEVNPKQYSYNGSSTLPPLIIGGNALYIQARGSIVRDLAFDYQVEGYRGNDLTIFSAHMFDGYQLTDWAYQQIPHSVVWVVRDDGTLLGLTYIREHQMWGWHRHDTDGTFENVVSVPEGDEDAVYVVVNRTIDGDTKRYVERFAQRRVDDIEDSIFMDSSLSYDGRNTNSLHTMTLSEHSSGGWLYTSTINITSSTSYFTSADVGNAIFLTGADGTIVRVAITEYVSGTVVRGLPNKTVPVAMRSSGISDWAKAVSRVTGLWHLEGQTVSVFADGDVVANPNNESYEEVTVTNGLIDLDNTYSVIHIGMPYFSDIETLDIDTAQGETLADKKKLVTEVTLFVEESRGIWVGAKPPTDDDDDPLEDLEEFKARSDEGYDDPVTLQTGTVDIQIKSEWNSNGRVFIRQTDPIPLAVLAVVPSGLMPFRG